MQRLGQALRPDRAGAAGPNPLAASPPAPNQPARWLQWTCALTLLFTVLLTYRTTTGVFVVLIPGLVLAMAVWIDRWGGRAAGWGVLHLLALGGRLVGEPDDALPALIRSRPSCRKRAARRVRRGPDWQRAGKLLTSPFGPRIAGSRRPGPIADGARTLGLPPLCGGTCPSEAEGRLLRPMDFIRGVYLMAGGGRGPHSPGPA